VTQELAETAVPLRFDVSLRIHSLPNWTAFGVTLDTEPECLSVRWLEAVIVDEFVRAKALKARANVRKQANRIAKMILRT